MSSVTHTSRSADHATTHGDPAVRALIDSIPRLALAGDTPTPIEELSRLRESLGMRARLLVKRDDALTFGAGGNKVRKLEVIAARATADGADTLVTTGGVQSNHARVTAAAAARLGLECILVVNGEPPARATGNALLMQLFGAKMEYVATRQERAPRVEQVIDRLHGEGRRPYAIPLGASTPVGALGYVRAIAELLTQMAGARRHHPLVIIWRHAGRPDRRLRAVRPAHEGDWREPRRSVGCDRRLRAADSRGHRIRIEGDGRHDRARMTSPSTIASSAAATASRATPRAKRSS